jgi:methionyl aminopeptidase
MSISHPEELEGLRRAGRAAARILRGVRAEVRPGITTGELDAIAERLMRREGARSAPRLEVGFPGAICISVNDEAVHGIPGDRRLRSGDLVKLDVTIELGGFFADTAVTVPVGAPDRLGRRLSEAAEAGLRKALGVATAGRPLADVGRAIENEVRRRGFSVLPELTGHGIGRAMHEPPTVPQHWVPGLRTRLQEGLVMTIEPIISAGGSGLRELDDGWTLATADGSLSAHVEHTLVITRNRPLVLTAA